MKYSRTVNTITNAVNGIDSHSMDSNAAIAEIIEENICGNDCEMAWRSVSVSLV